MLVKLDNNFMVQTTRNFELFDKKKKKKKKNGFFITIFDKELTPFWKTFLQLKLLFNAKLLIYRLSSFSVLKITALRHPISLNENLPWP